jgi:hypothetical protein
VILRFLDVAQAELDEAFEWYRAISRDLGEAFLIEAFRIFRLIEQYPRAWHPASKSSRRCRLARFPYGVIYAEEGDDQLIVAVAHLHREPLYWRARLEARGQ